ncbi:MAG: hypothetical protein NZ739_11890, partial [Verrucomicrobiae bacterium]|nr:hypothetical protein [Verrucomicrobiae bacterium]
VVNTICNYLDHNAVINSPLTASVHIPFALRRPTDWSQLASDLANKEVRNFFYFGHGWKKGIGYIEDTNRSLCAVRLADLLGNKLNAGTNANQHVYRFVFLFGCRTAYMEPWWLRILGIKSKKLCAAFGVPAKRLTLEELQKYGLQPCAFVGFRSKVWRGSYTSQLFRNYLDAIENFFWTWPRNRDGGGTPYTLEEALNETLPGSLKDVLVIYGYPGLTFR